MLREKYFTACGNIHLGNHQWIEEEKMLKEEIAHQFMNLYKLNHIQLHRIGHCQ